jgi:hypothetical protein
MAIRIVNPGLSTTVQDLGRPGYYNIGIPLSGGMDRFALRAANMLVGNDEGAAVLEAVFLGPEIEFETDATVAVTGAELPPKVDRNVQPTWTSLNIRKGQEPAPTSQYPAESMFRSFWGAGPPMPWARLADMRAGSCRQVIACA